MAGQRQHFFAWVVRLLWALGLTHCTVLSDFDVYECSSSEECELLDGGIRHCKAARCEPGCSDSAHCASVDPARPLCPRRGAECVALVDAERVCSVASGYDERAFASLTLEDVDVIGAFAPTPRSSAWLSAQLAASEWNAERAQGSGARPLLVSSCNDAVESLEDALTHLRALGAKAVLAPQREATLRAALESFASHPPGMFVLSPAGSAFAPQSVPGGELLWYLGADYFATLPAYAQLLPRVIEVGQASLAAPGTLRLASVTGADAEDAALEQQVLELLRVDDRDRARLRNEDRLLEFSVGAVLPAEPERALEPLLQPLPNVVLLFMGPEEAPTAFDAATIVQLLEARVETLGAPLPLYVAGPRSSGDVALQKLVSESASLRARWVGVAAEPSPDAARRAALQQRFVAAYPVQRSDAARQLGAAALIYDATYLLAYGLVAARSATDVLAGFQRVTDAAAPERVSVGPGADGLGAGLQLLSSGRSFQLEGASGPCHFEAQGHTRTSEPRARIIGADGQPLDTDPAVALGEAATLE